MWTAPTTLVAPGPPPPPADKFLRNGNADMQILFGADATDIYRPGAFTKYNDIVGDIAGNHLVKGLGVGMDYPVAYTGLANDPLSMYIADSNYMRGPQASHEIGTGPLAAFFGFSVGTLVTHLNCFFGKLDNGGVNGYVLGYEHDTLCVWTLRTSTTFLRLYFTCPSTAARVGVLLWRSVTLGRMGATPSWQADVSQVDTTAGQSITATGGISLGATGARYANRENIAFLAVCEGAEAEKAVANRVEGVAAWTALPE